MEAPSARGAPEGRVAGTGPPRPRYDRALRVGLLVSAAVHVVALAAYPLLMRGGERAPAAFLPTVGVAPEGLNVVQVVAVEGDVDPERPEDPEEVEEVEGPQVDPARPDVGPGRGIELVAPGPTAAERLRPSLRDARLWAPLDPELNELTLEQRLELEMAARIEGWQDSLDAATEAERARTDWTYTDAEGGRWGVSPGQIHLGDVTIPLPFGFGTPVGKRDEANRRAWEWEEIQRGAGVGAVRDSWKDRAAAIRARRDRERAAAKPDTSGLRR